MVKDGSRYYDNNEFFINYMEKRLSKDNPNDTIEKPIFLEMIGICSKHHVLDFGCGNGDFGKDLLRSGCKSYTGIEGSENMYLSTLKHLNEFNNLKFTHSTIENWQPPKEQYDLVVSRLVLHYIENIDDVFEKVYQSLKKGGRFIFSIEHPVITSTLQKSGQRTNWIIDHYFSPGFREQQWLGTTVYKYHRTIEDYFTSLQKAGFSIKLLRESKPKRENFEHPETYNRRLRIPLFLFLSSTKE